VVEASGNDDDCIVAGYAEVRIRHIILIKDFEGKMCVGLHLSVSELTTDKTPEGKTLEK
jgi:hypothetical protein